MRIGFDARALASPVHSGVEHYVRNLLPALVALGAPEMMAYSNLPVESDPSDESDARLPVRVVRARRGWLRAALPWRLWRDGADLVHLPSTIVPPILPCPAVVTVHDLAWARYPETYDPADLRMQTQVVPRSIGRAAHVVAVSRSTADDLLETLTVPAAKITVTPLGVSSAFRPDGPRLASDAFAGAERVLREGCVLHTGGLHPRKNVARLIDAYAAVSKQMEAPPLVIAGGRDPRRETGKGVPDVIFTGQLCEGVMPALYRAATVVVYPSLYEGFGLPILEAMASGVPVVTSDRSSMKEVAGEAALLVDPEDVDDIVRALTRVLSDDVLRNELVQKGVERSREFTWERTARGTVEAYHKALGQRG
ncbi:MAG: glycosyltransferase family 4 protein [Armatimonadota bacterium]